MDESTNQRINGSTGQPVAQSAPPVNWRLVALFVAAGLIVGGALHLRSPRFNLHLEGSDVHFVWMEGGRILAGTNPYARILTGDLVHNEKYATYLPLPYVLAAGLRLLRPDSFERWLRLWRPLVQAADLGVLLALMAIPWRRGLPLLGLLGGVLWAFSRWSLYCWETASTEPFVLLSLIGALALWRSHPRAAGILAGISLGFKHIAVLLLPVLLLQPGEPWRLRLRRLGWTAIVPCAVAAPFVLWSPAAFVRSMLFSATREASATLPSSGDILTMTMLASQDHGLVLRWALLLALAVLWVVAVRLRLGLFTTAFLAFTLFCAFNPVLYTQYFAWPHAFVPLMLAEGIRGPGTQGPGDS